MFRIIVFFIISANIAFSKCIPKTDIQRQQDDTFIYTAGCHVEFGEFRLKNRYQQKQIQELKQAITLKDLAYSKANTRADMWRDVSYQLKDNIVSLEKSREKTKYTYFVIGFASAIGVAWGLNQIKQ